MFFLYSIKNRRIKKILKRIEKVMALDFSCMLQGNSG